MFANPPRRRRPLVLGVVAVAAAIGLVALVALLSRPAPVEDVVTVEPEPEPEPDPPPPVSGAVGTVEVVDLSVAGTQLFGSSRPEDEPVPLDEAAVDAFVAAVAAALDEHLTALQLGDDGLVASGAFAGSTDVLDVLGPELLAVSVRYEVVVAARGTPEWAVVDLEVARDDGSTVTRNLVVAAGAPVELVAAEPVP